MERLRRVALAVAIGLVLSAAPALGHAGDLLGLSDPDHDATARPVQAGAAVVDATWHVGASAGQYASDGTPIHPGAVDPSLHSTRRRPSDGIESRLSVRALVVEGGDGERVAVVANPLYIPQALLNARVVTILADRDAAIDAGRRDGPPTRIDWDHLMVGVNHSHSSPYYSTPAWGVWAFQDVFDLRFYEFMAQRMAEAVVEAVETLRPATVGAHRVPFDLTQRHSFGPTVADDGTPAGYPETDNDKVIDVVAVDGLDGSPIATWVTFGLHPEMLDGNDLHSGEYVGQFYRFVDRTVGGVTLFSQNNTGTSEPGRDARAQPPEARAEYSHKEYAQMTRAGVLLAQATVAARAEVTAGRGLVPARGDLEVSARSEWFAPPGLRLSPTVSSCRTEKAFAGNPGVPLVGLPDCVFPVEEAADAGLPLGSALDELPFDTRVTYDQLREAGVPVPDNVGVPSLTGLQETAAVHLQAIRLGDIGITVCPCEQWADQSRNIKTRIELGADGGPQPLWLGFDWTAQQLPTSRTDRGPAWCEPTDDDRWVCGDPRTLGETDLEPVSDLAYRRMVAQVVNDAAGWDDAANSARAEFDPPDPADIWGNYTHERLVDDPSFDGYRMVITAGMANDYWGYIATYREFQRGDHYRKALTGLGPHSSDFLATRLSRLAAGLSGYDGGTPRTPKDDVYAAVEPARVLRTARLLGDVAAGYVPLYAATLPADGGDPTVVAEPAGVVERFGAASVSWVGGSNWFDVPRVAVERLDQDLGWVPYEDMTGGVQVRLELPELAETVAWRTTGFEWQWTATFEAHSSDLGTPDLGGTMRWATPTGTYRFVIEGTRHLGGGVTEPYSMTSRTFDVAPWRGITVESLTVDTAGRVVVEVGPRRTVDYGSDRLRQVGPVDYPDSYGSPFPFIDATRELKSYRGGHEEQFCFHCSFEPWLDTADAASVTVVVTPAEGSPYSVVAESLGAGRWLAPAGLDAGDVAAVLPGGIVDRDGNTNHTGAEVTA